MEAATIDVTVTVNGITHSWPDDIDLLLESPSGDRAVFYSDAGGSAAVDGVTLTLGEASHGTVVLPDNGPLVSGTFLNADYGEHSEEFTIDGTTLDDVPGCLCVFDGDDPNGTWRLYAVSDGGGAGSLSGGWSLTITTNSAPVVEDQAFTTGEDTPLVVTGPGLLAGATDADGDALTVSPSGVVILTIEGEGGPSTGTLQQLDQLRTDHGTVAMKPDGSFTYTPDLDLFLASTVSPFSLPTRRWSRMVDWGAAAGTVAATSAATATTATTTRAADSRRTGETMSLEDEMSIRRT